MSRASKTHLGGWPGRDRQVIRGLAAVVPLCALIAAPGIARADLIPPGLASIEYSYELEGLASHPGITFLEWPRTCTRSGEPIGEDQRDVDPSKLLEHTIDYEVLGPGRHELMRHCARSARIYALDAASYPVEQRVAAEHDLFMGFRKGEPHSVVPELDALTIKARARFFAVSATTKQARKASFVFPAVFLLRETSPVRKIHDILTVRALDETHFEVAPVRVQYELSSGARVEVAWTGGDRPPPPGKSPRTVTPPRLGPREEDASTAGDDEDVPADAPDAGTIGSPSERSHPLRTLGIGFAIVAVVVAGTGAFLLRRKRR